jgi:hypothetical protein
LGDDGDCESCAHKKSRNNDDTKESKASFSASSSVTSSSSSAAPSFNPDLDVIQSAPSETSESDTEMDDKAEFDVPQDVEMAGSSK